MSQDNLSWCDFFSPMSPICTVSPVPRTLQLFVSRLRPKLKETKKRSCLTTSGIRIGLSHFYLSYSLKQIMLLNKRKRKPVIPVLDRKSDVPREWGRSCWWASFWITNLSKDLTDPYFDKMPSQDGNVELLLLLLKLNNLGKNPVQETSCCLRCIYKRDRLLSQIGL